MLHATLIAKKNKTEKTEEEEAEDIVGFFQSNLKQ